MKLNNETILQQSAALREKGYLLPAFDHAAVKANTAARPEWVHFGAGNIFRAFIAALNQELLNSGRMDTGIIVAEGFDAEILDAAYRPFDNLSVLATLCADGRIRKTILGSVVNSLDMERGTEDWAQLEKAFCSPSLKMASLTITEKGYNIADGQGNYFPAVQSDMEQGPEKAGSYLGKIAALCHARFAAGGAPIALVSMDNCSHNGSRLESAVLAIADAWAERGLCRAGFTDYLRDKNAVSFPWSMIDKITPRPDDSVREMLEKDGLEDMGVRVTGRRSYVAPFVNAEEAQYLVVEDAFPNGRPPLDQAGVIFTSRDVVDMVETMKVCTCLNPLHTCLAVLGCLLGFERISAEMQDEDLKKLVEIVGYQEGLPVVVDPGVISPRAFIDEVIGKRFPNPFLQDTPQRIATDTSQKVGIRFGETIKSYVAQGRDLNALVSIPLAIAGWMRYLLAVDDNLEPMEVSADPMKDELQAKLAGIEVGKPETYKGQLREILSYPSIFGSDLCAAGLADRIEQMFVEELAGAGAVRATLHKYIG